MKCWCLISSTFRLFFCRTAVALTAPETPSAQGARGDRASRHRGGGGRCHRKEGGKTVKSQKRGVRHATTVLRPRSTRWKRRPCHGATKPRRGTAEQKKSRQRTHGCVDGDAAVVHGLLFRSARPAGKKRHRQKFGVLCVKRRPVARACVWKGGEERGTVAPREHDPSRRFCAGRKHDQPAHSTPTPLLCRTLANGRLSKRQRCLSFFFFFFEGGGILRG